MLLYIRHDLKDIIERDALLETGMIVTNINADFLDPISYSDQIAIQTAVTHLGNKSLHYIQGV